MGIPFSKYEACQNKVTIKGMAVFSPWVSGWKFCTLLLIWLLTVVGSWTLSLCLYPLLSLSLKKAPSNIRRTQLSRSWDRDGKMRREELTPDGIVHGSEFIREPPGSDFCYKALCFKDGNHSVTLAVFKCLWIWQSSKSVLPSALFFLLILRSMSISWET